MSAATMNVSASPDGNCMATGAEKSANRRLILPDRKCIEEAAAGNSSYAIYNYYGRGPISAAKRRRFQIALDLGFEEAADRVIDMGCADGLLLPTLSRYCYHVAAIDLDREFVARSRHLVSACGLSNVQVVCNSGLPIPELRQRIGSGYRLMFLLETLEHVGRQPDIWRSKIDFLNECFQLLETDGRIVISVPKMVGMIVLFKHVVQRCFGLSHDELTWRQLLRSAILKDTDDLEPLWDGHHVGFNHLKLDTHLQDNFSVLVRRESAMSVFYLVAGK
jgi:2-polyprenyl-3-methyl-5-hydroxy-6-metoxy-1,4-benzoquinol methylase